MAIPRPDYPVDFPTESALVAAQWILTRPDATKRDAYDSAVVVALWAAGKLAENIGKPTPRIAGEPKKTVKMTDAQAKAFAKKFVKENETRAAADPKSIDYAKWLAFALKIIMLFVGA